MPHTAIATFAKAPNVEDLKALDAEVRFRSSSAEILRSRIR